MHGHGHPIPSSPFKWDVRLLTWARKVQRDTRRPQKGDTHPVSTQQPLYARHIPASHCLQGEKGVLPVVAIKAQKDVSY